MRIALVITELFPGGAEKCLVNLAIFLHQQGHQVCVWQLWPDPPEDRRQLIRKLDEFGIPHQSCEASKPQDFLPGVKRLRRQLAEYEPDIIQSFLFHANLACALASRTTLFSRKRSFNGHIFGGVRVRQPQRWRWRAQRFASNRMTKLVCVSREVARHCSEQEAISQDKLEIIPNGIDLADLPVTSENWGQFGIPDSAPVVLYAGRLDEQKQVRQFLENSPAWLAKVPDAQLVLMGDGPLKSEIEILADKINESEKKVHLIGWQEDALAWMRSATVVVLPAAYEGMPNVILEAMALGKPVVTFAVDGIEELLGNPAPNNEQVIAPNDFDRFGNAITQVLSSSELQQQLGLDNSNQIAARFQLKDLLQQYESMYIAALNGR